MPNRPGSIRKPTSVLELSGAIAKNPKRHAARRSEPKPVDGIGNPPAHFGDAEAAIWFEIIAQCAPGVLFCSDRLMLEQISVLVFKSRSGKITAMERALLGSMLQQFGMSPVTRSRIAVAQPEKKDSTWTSFLNPGVSAYTKQ
ncbi:MAG TPA: hypothetical protein VFN53_06490 [Acidobacteriaceae bacterium]|nr:hypothetical protein [Acidobacteriaceae bacterium]